MQQDIITNFIYKEKYRHSIRHLLQQFRDNNLSMIPYEQDTIDGSIYRTYLLEHVTSMVPEVMVHLVEMKVKCHPYHSLSSTKNIPTPDYSIINCDESLKQNTQKNVTNRPLHSIPHPGTK